MQARGIRRYSFAVSRNLELQYVEHAHEDDLRDDVHLVLPPLAPYHRLSDEFAALSPVDQRIGALPWGAGLARLAASVQHQVHVVLALQLLA